MRLPRLLVALCFLCVVLPVSSQNIWNVLRTGESWAFLQTEINRQAQSLIPVLSSGNNNLTMFAPTEEAMIDASSWLLGQPSATVLNVFTYHIAPGAMNTTYLATQYIIQSLYAPASMGNQPQRLPVFYTMRKCSEVGGIYIGTHCFFYHSKRIH